VRVNLLSDNWGAASVAFYAPRQFPTIVILLKTTISCVHRVCSGDYRKVEQSANQKLQVHKVQTQWLTSRQGR